MNVELIKECVDSLIGPANPIADSSVDAYRYQNLEKLCKLTDMLICQIGEVSSDRDSTFRSKKKCGEYAYKFLKNLRDELDEDIEK